MKLQTLNTEYIQKSRLFLYPLLDIKRGVSTTPIEVFMSWQDNYCFTDSMLICRYHNRDDEDFHIFDQVKLSGNTLFHERIELADGTLAFVFDLSDFKEDFWKVTKGEYSELSTAAKNKIRKFFNSHTEHYVYIQSYLTPKNYYAMFAEVLACDINALKHAKELCSKPDLIKETLELAAKVVSTENNPVNLHPNQ
jgi:hypothetical protein